WKRLLYGVPVILAIAAVLGIGIAMANENNEALAKRYSDRAEANDRDGNKKEALADAEAAYRNDPQDWRLMMVAHYAAKASDLDRVTSICKSLAPTDGPGLPSARWILADIYLKSPTSSPEKSAANRAAAKEQLLRLVDEADFTLMANHVLGKIAM